MYNPHDIPRRLDKNKDHLQYFTVLFISFLRGCFSGRVQGDFRWCEDMDKTELVIADQNNMITDKYLPRIITVRGQTTPLPIMIKDFCEENVATRAEKRSKLMDSSITFHCIAKLGIEAQYIAQQVQEYIDAYYRVLHNMGIHKINRTLSISPETPANAVFNPEVVPEGTLIMVTCQFWYRHTFTVTPSNLPAAREVENYVTAAIGNKEQSTLSTIRPSHMGVSSENPDTKLDLQKPLVEKL
jgi:hypothetical protein